MSESLLHKSLETPMKFCKIKHLSFFGQEATININILGGTVSGTNRNRPWDKRDPSRGQIGNHAWDKPALLCLISQGNRCFVPFVPGKCGGSSGTTCPHKGFQKNVYVSSFDVFGKGSYEKGVFSERSIFQRL